MASKRPRPTVRPLRVRPGARYTCFGDGLCCTDLHGLGPLTRPEVRALRVIADNVVLYPSESEFEEPMLRLDGQGRCLYLRPDRCELHATKGAEVKPDGCRRFPLGLTATPRGGRITTRHRCPCRTMGDRPDIESEDAARSLVDKAGRLQADRRIGDRIALTKRKKVSFAEWEAVECELLARLARGEEPPAVLDAKPFPRLGGTTWDEEADEMLSRGVDGTRFGFALAWFARSVHALTDGPALRVPEFSWADAFDRAEARSPEVRQAGDVLADWIADEIWSLQWADQGGIFSRCRADLSTRYLIARDIQERRQQAGARPDRAAAEAVAVVDLVAESEWWEDVQAWMKV